MSVQVIMKDGRPEWAVIPYEQYEELLKAAGKQSLEVKSAAAEPVAERVSASSHTGVFSVERLRTLQQSLNRSAQEMAKDAGISPAYFTQIIAGERSPSPAIIRGLAQALGVKADDVLD